MSTRPLQLGGPTLTKAGRACFAALLLLLVLSALAGQPAILATATLFASVLVVGLLSTRQAIQDAQRLHADLASAAGSTRTRNTPISVVLTLTYQGQRPLRATLTLRASGQPTLPEPLTLIIPARATATHTFEVCFPRVGQWHLHGLEITVSGPLGVTIGRLYLPCDLVLSARPRPLSPTLIPRILAQRGVARDRGGRHLTRQRGTGMELRELREYVPGDAIRRIAWRATARRGRPQVRDFEEESIRRIQLLLDIGPTMRAGPSGQSPLDRAIDLCATLAEGAIHDRLGLTTFDLRVYGHLQPASGRIQLQRTLRHLMDLTRVVDDDLTETSDAELIAQVGAFIEWQDGHRLGRDDGPNGQGTHSRTLIDPLAELYDIGALFAVVTSYLSEERKRGHAALFAKSRPAQDTTAARLRLFCALRGLSLPYRLTGPDDASDRGLVEAVGRNLHPGSAPRLIVLSDLRGIDPNGAGIRALALARARKKEVIVVDMSAEPNPAVLRALRAARARIITARSLPGML